MHQILLSLIVTVLLLMTLPLWAQDAEIGDILLPITTANIRSCASTDCPVVASSDRNRPMELLGAQEGQEISGSTLWYHVETLRQYRNWTFPRTYVGYVHSSLVETITLSGTASSTTSQSTPTPRSANIIRNIYQNARISPLTLEWYPEIVPVGTEQHLDDDGLDINVLALVSGNNSDEYAIISVINCAKNSSCEISARQFTVSYTLDNSDPTANQQGQFYFGQELLPLTAEGTPQPEIRLRPHQEEVIVIFLGIDDWRPQTAAVSFLSKVALNDTFWYIPTVLTFSEFENMMADS